MDFVFDRSADGRIIKNLDIVDDATHESVLIRPERAISGLAVIRILDEPAITRGLPRVSSFKHSSRNRLSDNRTLGGSAT